MIRFVLQLILVVTLSYLSQWFLPWWGVMLGSGLATVLVYNKALSSFIAGFIGLGGLWFYFSYTIDMANKSLLSTKIAHIFGLGSSLQLIIATALLGAIIGSASSLTGNLFAAMFKKTKKHYSPYH